MKEYIYHDLGRRGTIARVTYTAPDREGTEREKYANVYLPYGYDPENKSQRYNVLYLMHGGGGNPDAWLDTCCVKNMLDLAFDTGEADPFIVVFPTYYMAPVTRRGGPDVDFEGGNVRFFQAELADRLIPAVESRFHTYALQTTPDGLRASRTHRAFGGFSMGAATTWFALLDNLDYISVFIPLSGDCWVLGPRGGGERPRETVAAIAEAIRASGHGPEDFRILAATGTKDIAYPGLMPQALAMREVPELFRYSDDPRQGNFHYFFAEGRVHTYPDVLQYLYNFLPAIFN